MIKRSLSFLARRKRDLQYARYLARHKWHVGRACLQNGLFVEAITHDLSKLLPSEWAAYREFFYRQGAQEDPETAHAFDLAWLAHQKRNPHHWQWWLLFGDDGTGKAIPMPKKKIVEMVCDWYGAGIAIHKHKQGWRAARLWYVQNAAKIRLHPVTEKAVVLLLAWLETNETGVNPMAQAKPQPQPQQHRPEHETGNGKIPPRPAVIQPTIRRGRKMEPAGPPVDLKADGASLSKALSLGLLPGPEEAEAEPEAVEVEE